MTAQAAILQRQTAPTATESEHAVRVETGGDTEPFPRSIRWTRRVLPWGLAVVFASAAMRNVGCGNPVSSDAARHAMNGALLHDLFWYGDLASPFAYAKQYYSRLPAISVPYHPPLFPAVEAVFYSALGVNLLAARLAVAVCVGLSALLLYRLVVATHGSHALACACTVSLFSLPLAQLTATDVMLEFPALVFLLAAVYQLREMAESFPLRRGLAFALLASAAMWTKQHAAFLALVPLLTIVLSRRWRLLAERTFWISSAVLAVAVIALAAFSHQGMGGGVSGAVAGASEYRTASHITGRNTQFYAETLVDTFGYVGIGVIAVSAAVLLFNFRSEVRQRGRSGLYLSWALAGALLPLVAVARNDRYLFFAFPALIVIGFVGIVRAAASILGRRWAPLAPLALAGLFVATTPLDHVSHLSGPSEAARALHQRSAKRVLFCGETDGAFIYAMRCLQTTDAPSTVIIRAEKLPKSTFQPDKLESFSRDYGIDYIVLAPSHRKAAWSDLPDAPAPSMRLIQRIQQTQFPNLPRSESLEIYEFVNAGPIPKDSLIIPLRKLRRTLKLDL